MCVLYFFFKKRAKNNNKGIKARIWKGTSAFSAERNQGNVIPTKQKKECTPENTRTFLVVCARDRGEQRLIYE